MITENCCGRVVSRVILLMGHRRQRGSRPPGSWRRAVKQMRTYYNDRHVKVTSEYVTIGDYRYPVSELREISTTRGPVHRMVVRTLSGGVSLVAMAILMSAVMPVAMTAATGLTGLLAVGSAFVLSRTHPREWTLWA